MRVRVHDPKIWSRVNQGLSYTASGAEAPVFPPKLTRVGVFSITLLVPIIIIMAENFTFPIHSAPFRLRLALEPLKKDRV